jgi:tetratricopeptide (TPR) repeat protein
MRRLILLSLIASPSLAWADLEPGHTIDTRAGKAQREASSLASDAAQALGRNDAAGALALAERAIGSFAGDGWAHYIRGEALVKLGRLDDALPEYKIAERSFPAGEKWSRSIALWGRANAYYQIGRCAEAKAAFGDYATFVRHDDARAAELAQQRSDGCKPPWVAPAVPTAAAPGGDKSAAPAPSTAAPATPAPAAPAAPSSDKP